MNTTITRLFCITIALAFFLSALTVLAQPATPVAADTAWDVFPNVINVHCGKAKSDRNGNWLCTVEIRDTGRFGSTVFPTKRNDAEQAIAKYSSDGTPLWISPAGNDDWEYFGGFDADLDGNSFAIFYAYPNTGRADSLQIGHIRLDTRGGSFLAKYSPAGNLLWAIQLGDSIRTHDVAADETGGVIIVGDINGRSIYGEDTLTVSGKKSPTNTIASVVISVAPDGSFRWTRLITRKTSTSATNVITAPNGDIVVTGVLFVPVVPDTTIISGNRITSPGLYVARYHANGDVVWARGITSGIIELDMWDMAVDSTGNIILAGTIDREIDQRNIGKIFWDTLGAAGQPIPMYGFGTPFITKMSGDGRFLWAQVMQGRDFNLVSNVLAAPDDGILLTGSVSGHLIFGGHDYYAQGANAMYAARYEANGNPGWLKIYDARGPGSAAQGGRNLLLDGARIDREGRLWMIGGFAGWIGLDSFTVGTVHATRREFLLDRKENTFAVRVAPGTYTPPERIWTHIDDGIPQNRVDFGAPDVKALARFGGRIHAGLAPGNAKPWQLNAGKGVYSSSTHGTIWTRDTGFEHPDDSIRYGVSSFAALGDSLYTVTGLFSRASYTYAKVMVAHRNSPNRWNWLQRGGDPDLLAVYSINGVLYGAARTYEQDTAYGLLRWSRDSMTWNRMDTTVLGTVKVQALTGYRDVLVATAYDYKGLFRSGGRGRTWERVSNGLPLTADGQFPGAHDLATIDTTIYLAPPAGMGPGFPTGVYRSDDGGASWTQANEGLPRNPYGPSDTVAVVVDILYAKHGALFAGGEEGIWMLAPGATRWVTITDDIQQCRVNALLADDTCLYAAMSYGGMWRRPLSTLGIEAEKEEEPEPMPAPGIRQSNLTVTPNPVKTSSLIRFTLPEAGNTTVSLHDANGKMVHVIAKEVMADGDHELVLDMRGLPSGPYFVRVQNGDWSESFEVVYPR